MEIFNPQSNNWTVGPSMQNEHLAFGTAVIAGKLYAVGGAGANASLNVMEIYSPAMGGK